MSEKPEKQTMVKCRRTEAEYDVHEHLRCPYCYGKEVDVETRDRSNFCDFDPKRDPLNFGFPPDGSRVQRG